MNIKSFQILLSFVILKETKNKNIYFGTFASFCNHCNYIRYVLFCKHSAVIHMLDKLSEEKTKALWTLVISFITLKQLFDGIKF